MKPSASSPASSTVRDVVARDYELAYETILRFTSGASLPIQATLIGELSQRAVIRDTSVPMGVITRVLQIAPPPVGAPGTFSLADEEVLRRAFTYAGFAEVANERHTLTLEYSSLDEFIEERPATSASIRSMLADASPAQLETIWQIVAEEIGKYRQPSGVLRIPNETLCVVGKA